MDGIAYTKLGPPKKPAKNRQTARAANDRENEAPKMKRPNIGKETR